MTRQTNLKMVPADERLTVREEARRRIESQVAKLKPDSNDAKTATRLLNTLTFYLDNPRDEEARKVAINVVQDRIERLKRIKPKGRFDAGQCRDLKIVIHYINVGNGLDDLRKDACALLQLWGDEKSVDEICLVYPGLRKLFG